MIDWVTTRWRQVAGKPWASVVTRTHDGAVGRK